MQELEIEAPKTTNYNCNNTSPRDMVCLGNVCMDTLHKGDDDDDDDDKCITSLYMYGSQMTNEIQTTTANCFCICTTSINRLHH
jgi:hypothetical protein